MEDKKRNIRIDILRGIATLSVLLGHAIQRGIVVGYQDNAIFKFIYSFHMPLFVILSGYALIYTKKFDSEFLIKKFKRLIIPTILWSYILFFIRGFEFVGIKEFIPFPNSIIEYTKIIALHPDFVIWFLYVIFLCSLIIYIGKKIFPSNDKSFWILMIAVAFGLYILPNNITKFFGIEKVKIYLPIFLLGYSVANYKDSILKYLNKMIIPAIVIYIIAFSYYHTQIDNILIYYLISTSAIIVIYSITKLIEKNSITTSILTYFGKYSLEIYLLQCICLNIGVGQGVVRILTIFVSATTISSILACITNKNKLVRCFLYGK